MRLIGWTSKKYNPDGEAIGIEILPDRVAFAGPSTLLSQKYNPFLGTIALLSRANTTILCFACIFSLPAMFLLCSFIPSEEKETCSSSSCYDFYFPSFFKNQSFTASI